MSSKEVIVTISLGGEDIRVGKLWIHVRKGRESASFEYGANWLKHPEKFALEPALKLTEGAFHTQSGMDVFGSIGDSTPDRWGRVLMRRNETARARSKNTTPRTLLEVDYLLGVNDEARQGALRFSLDPDEYVFLTPGTQDAIPPLVDLPRLLSAAEHFIEDNESAEDLRLLLAPGSSLGGARPKASIRDQDGSLAMAKFPRKDDDFDVVRWETVALTLAGNAGLNVPSWRLEAILGKPVLIIKRFDRQDGHRTPFLSAMSMLGARDHEQHSYLEMAYALAQHGAAPEKDMAELWRRIVFTIMISNTDDHLRNHGFVFERFRGWRLSPVYDINPTPIELKPRILTTAIDFDDTSASLETALAIAGDFRLSGIEAREIVKEVAGAVKLWRKAASDVGLTKREADRMASAFEHDDLEKAEQL
jgi:serine/threonine-protein kinase HipA